jgi:hypothetical protein
MARIAQSAKWFNHSVSQSRANWLSITAFSLFWNPSAISINLKMLPIT